MNFGNVLCFLVDLSKRCEPHSVLHQVVCIYIGVCNDFIARRYTGGPNEEALKSFIAAHGYAQ